MSNGTISTFDIRKTDSECYKTDPKCLKIKPMPIVELKYIKGAKHKYYQIINLLNLFLF